MFSARQAITDADLEPFPFEDSRGEPRTAPHIKSLTLDQGTRVLVDGELKEVLNELEPGLGDEVGGWPAHVIEDFTAAWMEHSGVILPGREPGKSSTSSPSSPSTGPRSKRTSRSAGSRSRR